MKIQTQSKEEYIKRIAEILPTLKNVELHRIYTFCFFLRYLPSKVTEKFWSPTNEIVEDIEKEIKEKVT